ncbi:DUF4394 domain-containing protein [Lentzea flaviverrucosa]|uniref:DUF4394 domain-containing protein n=1 Tax=Lentzea flaviverrucosa TaxID=200379 RepID=A0A1H9XSG3_9PSEU|nr:DUF4394 domain-containing protein [Lentzea flaviverrucosa]RDI19306.1 uncharacterized protein DUF4394 [Lentzea flaviverrucosa]SES49098.1 protein of unknown function [Lentzea flaviverrucosa]
MRIVRTTVIAAAAALLADVLGAAPASASGDQLRVHLLTDDGVLSTRTWSSPLFAQYRVRVTGLKAHDRLAGIDVRPATGVLYAIGRSGQLYTLDTRTGRVTTVSLVAKWSPAPGTERRAELLPDGDRCALRHQQRQRRR